MVDNPILQAINNSGNADMSLISSLKSSPNPQSILQAMPQYRQAMQYVQQNGGDPKTAFYNLAAQKGINPNIILNKIK